MSANDQTATAPHSPAIIVGTGAGGLAEALHFIPTQQRSSGTTFITVGTLVIQLFVDSTGFLSVDDPFTTANEQFSVSGYLLPLTPGASC
jgi:hypothetical protein